MSSNGSWVFEFNGDLVTYRANQPNRLSWTTREQTRGRGTLFVYTASGDLEVRQNRTLILRLRTSQIPHNHTGIDNIGRLALWNERSQFVRQINIPTTPTTTPRPSKKKNSFLYFFFFLIFYMHINF